MTSARRILAAVVLGSLTATAGALSCGGSSGGVHDGGAPDAAPRDAGADARRHRETGPDSPNHDAPDAGAPSLVSLSVSQTGDAEAGTSLLVPAFSPTTYDYYVRCASTTNPLTVSMAASKGARSLLLRPTPSAEVPSQTLSLVVTENDAILAAATDGVATTAYWVRCLPADVPELLWRPDPEAGAPDAGYYLVGNLFPPKGGGGYAMVLDAHGVPVWYARAPTPYGAGDVDDVVAGSISFIPFGPTAAQSFEIRQLSPPKTTPIGPDGYVLNLHELRVLPGGDFLGIANPLTYGVDLTGLTITLLDGTRRKLGPGSTIQDCAVVEFTASGEVVWTWLGSDHIDAKTESTYPTIAFGGATSPDGGTLVDVFHCNSVDLDVATGNLLVSARDTDALFYVDKKTGRVVWKMGGSTSSKDGATHVPVADPFYRQHDARFASPWSSKGGGAGQISVFDDETGRPDPARGALYDVSVGPPDAGGATLAWEYKGTRSTALAGSFRIGTDGSRVIGWGKGGAPDLVFSEVDVAGRHLLDFGFGDNDSSYRAIKVPLDAFDLESLRNAAGLP